MDKYAVVGNPIKHSQSPFIHDQFAHQTGQQLTYERILIPLDDFKNALKNLQSADYKGINVTLPFKHEAYLAANHRSTAASLAQAANTLVFHPNQTITAENTDGCGLIKDLSENLKIHLSNQSLLILGAGGATQGILGPLLSKNPRRLILANRTLEKAKHLESHFSQFGPIESCPWEEIPDYPFDMIINATSLSLVNDHFSLKANRIIQKETICYDLAYKKGLTPFLQWAKKMGSNYCYDGLGMLVEQAAAAFFVWRGIYPETTSVIAALKQQLNKT